MALPQPNILDDTQAQDPFMQYVMKLMAQMQEGGGGQSSGQHDPYSGLAQLVHPPTRHETFHSDIIPDGVDGIDWLHLNKKPTPAFDPAAAASTQAQLPGRPVIQAPGGQQQPGGLLPFTQQLMKPVGGKPGTPQRNQSAFDQLHALLKTTGR